MSGENFNPKSRKARPRVQGNTAVKELEFIDITAARKRSGQVKRSNGTQGAPSRQKRKPVQACARPKELRLPMEEWETAGRSRSQTQRARRPDRAEMLRRRKRRRRRERAVRLTTAGVLAVLFVSLLFVLWKLISGILWTGEATTVSKAQRKEFIRENDTQKPLLTENFLTKNPYSRPGDELKKVKSIFVHYTANPGTTAAQNRSYFENLGITGETSASAHFVIGYEGEIIQCLPLDEIGYAVKGRNEDSVSIECCYLDEDGKFTDATYQSLLQLTAWLMKEYKLNTDDVLRHFDEGGKACPLYFVNNSQSWDKFRQDLTDFVMN